MSNSIVIHTVGKCGNEIGSYLEKGKVVSENLSEVGRNIKISIETKEIMLSYHVISVLINGCE